VLHTIYRNIWVHIYALHKFTLTPILTIKTTLYNKQFRTDINFEVIHRILSDLHMTHNDRCNMSIIKQIITAHAKYAYIVAWCVVASS